MYYHPIIEYNVVSVRLKDCIVARMLLSNVTYSTTEDITKNTFYKQIDRAIQRVMLYPNLLTKPFRDSICLMTHNLDIDYDVPWYRMEFPRTVREVQDIEYYVPWYRMDFPRTGRKVQEDSLLPQSSQGYFSQQSVVATPCLLQADMPKPDSIHWKKFLQSVEESPEFEKLLKSEFSI